MQSKPYWNKCMTIGAWDSWVKLYTFIDLVATTPNGMKAEDDAFVNPRKVSKKKAIWDKSPE